MRLNENSIGGALGKCIGEVRGLKIKDEQDAENPKPGL